MAKNKRYLNDLTVFVISTGEDTTKECIQSLQSQDCFFKIEQIKGIYPMSRAFQTMPRYCSTRFFVQVDADMILNKDAIRTLYDKACSTGFFTAVVFGQLFEEGFGIGGAVRLWKKHMFRYVSFEDCRTVDRNLYKRSRLFGFRRKSVNQVLGIHRPRHSVFSEYLKTKADIEKWRFLKRTPEKYAQNLFDSLMEEPSKKGHRLLGFFLGSLTLKNRLVRSKDMKYEAIFFAKIMSNLGFFHDEPLVFRRIIGDKIVWNIFRENYINPKKMEMKYRDFLIFLILKAFSKSDITPGKFNGLKRLLLK
jgi:hypothetical protein